MVGLVAERWPLASLGPHRLPAAAAELTAEPFAALPEPWKKRERERETRLVKIDGRSL